MNRSLETPVSPKVTVAVVAAAVVTVLVYLIKVIWGVELDVVVQGAITTILVGVASWFQRDKLRDAGQAAINADNDTPVGEIEEVRRAS